VGCRAITEDDLFEAIKNMKLLGNHLVQVKEKTSEKGKK
jgi:hypothetical protein